MEGASTSFMVMLVIGYFIPTCIAGLRGHRNLGAIAVLNLLLGWTLLGWAAAAVWSFTSQRPPD